ncbi:phosphatase [Novosphingobium barchaimii LL02]|uniref:Phosphatase n=1 Tax=Novosphingobium barchaimii LL02 TaxID=1114963 RepID=A0A0J8AYC4_9SPHN|nr:phosphatase PAP2 family protein [Novosphingobium barchaimii]KMS59205.1 phosphatase [Novosphingobium barchaimii LL02]
MPSMRPSWATTATVVVAGQATHPEILTPALVAVRQSGPAIRRHLLVALLLNLVLLSTLLHLAQLHIDPLAPGNVPFYAAGLVALALRFGLPRTTWRHAAQVSYLSEYLGIFTIVTLMGASASYPVAALTHGYADVTLQAIDEALGFKWLDWYRLVADHPVLQALGTIAYRSIYLTPILLLWSAARSGQHGRAYRFIAGFWVASIITLATFTLMPAVGPFSHLWHEQIHYMPESELWQSGLIPALRAHTVHIVDLGHLRGIVSAPSFHTAAAVLYIVAGWRCPSLRWPVVVMNAAMLLSTPVEGTHYLIDMILGVMVALAALALIRLYERKVIARYHA